MVKINKYHQNDSKKGTQKILVKELHTSKS